MPVPPPEPMSVFDRHFMSLALNEARLAAAADEVPLGCVIAAPAVLEPAHDGHPPVFDWDPARARIVARGYNETETRTDATSHAEMQALRAASVACGNWRLTGCRLYVTKEPCPMCAGAIVLARLDAVVWGLSDPKRGGETVFGIFHHPGINHHPAVVRDVLSESCETLLTDFFRRRRA